MANNEKIDSAKFFELQKTVETMQKNLKAEQVAKDEIIEQLQQQNRMLKAKLEKQQERLDQNLPKIKEEEQLDTIERFHQYVTQKKRWEETDKAWQGVIKVNKTVHITVAGKKGEPVSKTIHGNEEYKCGPVILCRLIERAMQEGPIGKIKDWHSTGEPRLYKYDPTAKEKGIPALSIEIIREDISVSSREYYASDATSIDKKRIPQLI